MERPPVGQSRGRRGAKTTARTSESRQKGSKGEMPQPVFPIVLPPARASHWPNPAEGQELKVMPSIGVSLLGRRAGQRNE